VGAAGVREMAGQLQDIMTDRVANEDFAEFVREKIARA